MMSNRHSYRDQEGWLRHPTGRSDTASGRLPRRGRLIYRWMQRWGGFGRSLRTRFIVRWESLVGRAGDTVERRRQHRLPPTERSHAARLAEHLRGGGVLGCGFFR